jgi:hypothetical protein
MSCWLAGTFSTGCGARQTGTCDSSGLTANALVWGCRHRVATQPSGLLASVPAVLVSPEAVPAVAGRRRHGSADTSARSLPTARLRLGSGAAAECVRCLRQPCAWAHARRSAGAPRLFVWLCTQPSCWKRVPRATAACSNLCLAAATGAVLQASRAAPPARGASVGGLPPTPDPPPLSTSVSHPSERMVICCWLWPAEGSAPSAGRRLPRMEHTHARTDAQRHTEQSG